jgi:hypothetical protein
VPHGDDIVDDAPYVNDDQPEPTLDETDPMIVDPPDSISEDIPITISKSDLERTIAQFYLKMHVVHHISGESIQRIVDEMSLIQVVSKQFLQKTLDSAMNIGGIPADIHQRILADASGNLHLAPTYMMESKKVWLQKKISNPFTA